MSLHSFSVSFAICFLNSWNIQNLYLKNGTSVHYIKEPYVFVSHLLPSMHPLPFSHTSESVLLIRSRAAQTHVVGVPPLTTLPHPILNLTPLAPLVRFSCSIPQSPWFHQCYVMWGCMTMCWKEWFLCFGKRV